MGKGYKDTDYLHASTRVRALENNMLKAADFRKMVEARDAEEAYKVLADAPLCRGLAMAEYGRGLDRSLEEAYGLLEALAPGTGLSGLFRLKYDGHNLKTAIKARRLDTPVDHIYSPLGSVPVKELLAQLADGSLPSCPEPLAGAAVEALASFAKTGDPQAVDIQIDRAVLRTMALRAEEMGNPFLSNLVRTQVDVANIRAAVRLGRMGGDAAALGSVLVPGGALDPEKLERAGAEGMEALLDLVAAWRYGDALAPSFDGLRAGGSLTLFEKLCDNLLMSLLDEARRIPFGIEPLAAYLYAREAEARAARIVMASKLAGVPPQQITERLRETYG